MKVINNVTPPSHYASQHTPNSPPITRADLYFILKNFKPQHDLKIPERKCKTFSGEGERFFFRSFFLLFENIFRFRKDISNTTKLQYLKLRLSGYTLKDVEHLPNIDKNYLVYYKYFEGLIS